VLGFVLAEAAALCVIGGLLGLAVATPLGIAITDATGGNLPVAVDGEVWLTGAITVVVLSLAVGLLPALRAARLTIVDALAGR
jgi:putative ABC transport system permease protein